MKTVLSIDFDFWAEPHAFFDWGHREAPLFIGPIWTLRAADILNKFPSLEAGVGLPSDEPAPGEVDGLLRKWKCKINQLAAAESHVSAYHYFKQGLKKGEKLHLVHVDAHHDFGYGPKRQTADGEWELECGNWIEHLVEEKLVGKIDLIYPYWRNRTATFDRDWDAEQWAKRAKWIDKGVDMTHVPVHGLEYWLPKYNATFDKVFLCRSGAWVPPWLDVHFMALAIGLGTMAKRHTIYTYQSLSEFVREFDLKIAQDMADQTRKFLAEQNKPTKGAPV